MLITHELLIHSRVFVSIYVMRFMEIRKPRAQARGALSISIYCFSNCVSYRRLLSHKHNERLQLMIHKQQCWITKIFVRCQLCRAFEKLCESRAGSPLMVELNLIVFFIVSLCSMLGWVDEARGLLANTTKFNRDRVKWQMIPEEAQMNSSFVDAIAVESVCQIAKVVKKYWLDLSTARSFNSFFLWHFSNSYAHHFQPIFVIKKLINRRSMQMLLCVG